MPDSERLTHPIESEECDHPPDDCVITDILVADGATRWAHAECHLCGAPIIATLTIETVEFDPEGTIAYIEQCAGQSAETEVETRE